MKKVLFVFSILALMSYGCNKSGSNNTKGTGMERQEESRSSGAPESTPSNSDMGSGPSSSSSNSNQ